MKFSVASIASFLFLSGASAHPNAARREALANRGDKLAFDLSERHENKEPKKGAVFPKYYQGNRFSTGGPGGYAGPSAFASGIKKVSATVTVPQIIAPPGAVSGVSYGLAAWVGVQSGGALWQTGLTATVNTSSPAVYGLFWEEADNLPEEGFSNGFSYGAGDTLLMTVTVSGTYSGTAIVENLSTSQTAIITKTGLSAAIGSKSANFIVEDPGVSGGSTPFAAWSGAWQFTGCSYSGSDGQVFSLSTDGYTNIEIDGNNLTDVTILSSSSFSVTYVGTSADTALE